jgi:hypothetical protein
MESLEPQHHDWQPGANGPITHRLPAGTKSTYILPDPSGL